MKPSIEEVRRRKISRGTKAALAVNGRGQFNAGKRVETAA